MKVQWTEVLSDVLLGEVNKEACPEDWRRPFQKNSQAWYRSMDLKAWVTELVTANLSAGCTANSHVHQKLLCPKRWSG